MSSLLSQPPRRATRRILVGRVPVGGGAPVSVQTMTTTDTREVAATLLQIEQVAATGADLVRVAVPDEQAAAALAAIVRDSPLPIIADIHFDFRLALQAISAPVAGLRLNPGNLRQRRHVSEVAKNCLASGIPIRVGVNQGSLAPDIVDRFGGPTPAAMVASALGHIKLLEEEGFFDIKVSLKSHDVPTTIEAYRLLAEQCDYPFHLGITETGTPRHGLVKSAVGIGTLLALGLGDTIRVSLTADPVEEVTAGLSILRSLNLRQTGAVLVACPSCGRCEDDLIAIAQQVEEYLSSVDAPITVAVMGCVVNGIGEGKMADIGIALGKERGVLFKRGQIAGTFDTQTLIERLLSEIDQFRVARRG